MNLQSDAPGIQQLKKLALTLLSQVRRTLSEFDYPISFGIIEGINNKIGRLICMDDDYRDVEFLHLRIDVLNESKDRLTST